MYNNTEFLNSLKDNLWYKTLPCCGNKVKIHSTSHLGHLQIGIECTHCNKTYMKKPKSNIIVHVFFNENDLVTHDIYTWTFKNKLL